MKRFRKKIMTWLLLMVLATTNINLLSFRDVIVQAAESDRLITISGKNITKDMKIDDVKALFGEPKLETSSYWGGRACTFYGDNYSDYLYIETGADGKIVGYGSVAKGFQTNNLSYGDAYDHTYHTGTVARDDDDIVFGIMSYNDYYSNVYDTFEKNFVENSRAMCKHAALMWNAVSYLYGDNCPTTFDETMFNINAQLAENGSDFYEYCQNTGKDNYFQLCEWRLINKSYPEYPNPLAFASFADNYNCRDGYVPAFIYSKKEDTDSVYKTIGFINPDILASWKTVPYTQQEQELLEKARTEYTKSVELYNSAQNYYDVEPDYSALPLTGGKLNENIAKGAVGFLNSIRVGAGLNPLEYSEELSEDAQCKSTYTVYLAKNNIPNSNPHYPAKIDGISDEYYEKCQTGSGENLFMCGILSTDIIGSITYAIDDSYGTGQFYQRGHRYNLLDPNWQYIGVGNTLQQGCHKMTGYVESNVDVVAWPSKGITPIESGISAGTMMTCKFYNGYTGTENTTVTVHCLNSGKTWTINPDNLSTGQDINISGNLISYMDESMSFNRGGVYEITFSNLKNKQNEDVSYTYRSIYEKAYIAEMENTQPQSLKLDKSSLMIKPGTIYRIKASILPQTAENKRVNWKSEDTSVATVNECGEITAVTEGETYITVATEDGNITAKCKVVVSATASDPSSGDENNYPYCDGDVDGDAKVTLTDAQFALKAALNIVATDDNQLKAGDIDGDGKISLSDVLTILEMALNII